MTVAAGDGRGEDRLRRTCRWRDDGGTTAAEFAAGVGFLVLPMVVLVLSLPGWFEARHAARVAAAGAARAVAVAEHPDEGLAQARLLTAELLADHGVAAAHPLQVTSPDDGRPGTVTATVTVRVPALQLPFVGPVAGFDHAVAHTQALDRYRATSGGGP